MNLDAPKLTAILTRHNGHTVVPAVAVETGTFRGERALLFAEHFAEVHTIELSPTLFAKADARLAPYPHVLRHLGDSRALVPALATALAQPVLWYLDAHWFTLNRKRSRAGAARDAEAQIANTPLPLWDELEALAARTWADIVVVDDVRDFGRTEPTEEWRDVSLERIAAYFPGAVEAAVLADQAVVWR